MRSSQFFCLVFIFFLFSCKSETEKVAEKKVSREIIIDSTINQFQKKLLEVQIDSVFAKYNFNGAVAVIKDSVSLYQKFQGFENFETKKVLDSSSVFAIASNSKQFTAVLVLLQEEQGKLSTNDEVSKYLPEFQSKPLEKIKIKELLNHTSGISDFGDGLLSKPGEEFHYSNKGFRFLGDLVAKVSGKSYDENVLELFKKAGMNNSSTANIYNGNHLAGAWTGTAKNFQSIANMPKRLANKEISVPAGGLLSTVSDLNLWNQKLYNGKLLQPQSINKMTEKSSDRNHKILGKMGYGFGIMSSKNPPDNYFHSGYVKGAPSLLIYYPETKTSVIILSNIANEGIGKEAVFKPHREIKVITDAIQNTVISLRRKMIKPVATDLPKS